MGSKETIEVDTKKLREVAIKNNEKSISKLTDAIDKISGVKIPDDFSYKTELELLPNRIAGLQDTISDINRYIDKKAGEYEKIQGSETNGVNLEFLNPKKIQSSILSLGEKYFNLGDYIDKLKRTGSEVVDYWKSTGLKLFDGIKSIKESFDNTRSIISDFILSKVREFLLTHKRESYFINEDDLIYMQEYYRTGYYGMDQGIYNRMRCEGCIVFRDSNGANVDVISIYDMSQEEIDEYIRMSEANGLTAKIYRNIRNNTSESYNNSVKYISTKYGMTTEDAVKTLIMIDQIGACSYSNFGNALEMQYRDNPEAFEKATGIQLYKTDKDGNNYINTTEILADLYITLNLEGISDSKTPLFKKNEKGEIEVIDYADTDKKKQAYVSTSDGYNDELIEKYFKSKNANVKIDTRKYSNKDSLTQQLSQINEDLNKGYTVSIGCRPKRNIFGKVTGGLHVYNISMKDPNEIDIYKLEPYTRIDGGHIMTITGMTDKGFIVDNWGKRMFIPYNELLDRRNGKYEITTIKIDS